MASFKYLLSLLASLCFLTWGLAIDHFDHWAELPQCAKNCINFAHGTGVPPAGLCTSANITCVCNEGLWRNTCATCMRLGDTNGLQVAGCVDQSQKTIDAALKFVADVYCPTQNETEEEDPHYSSWSFSAATTSSYHPTSTSMAIDNSTTTGGSTSNMSMTLPATPADNPSTDGQPTSSLSVMTRTIHVSATAESSTIASETSTSTASCLVYTEISLVLSFWDLVHLV